MRFYYTVIVDTDTREHAVQVMAERLGYDEQYEDEAGVRFEYQLTDYYPQVPLFPDEGG